MKVINENLLTCRCVQAYAYARSARGCVRSCVYWGGRWKSGEERERKWGKEVKGGVNEGRKGSRSGDEGGAEDEEREKPNRKNLHAVQKGECGGKSGKDFPKIVGSRTQNEERREKSGLHRAKNERDLSKNRPKTDLKRGKAGKTEILERKRWDGGAAKNGLYCRFCNAMRLQNGRK